MFIPALFVIVKLGSDHISNNRWVAKNVVVTRITDTSWPNHWSQQPYFFLFLLFLLVETEKLRGGRGKYRLKERDLHHCLVNFPAGGDQELILDPWVRKCEQSTGCTTTHPLSFHQKIQIYNWWSLHNFFNIRSSEFMVCLVLKHCIPVFWKCLETCLSQNQYAPLASS